MKSWQMHEMLRCWLGPYKPMHIWVPSARLPIAPGEGISAPNPLDLLQAVSINRCWGPAGTLEVMLQKHQIWPLKKKKWFLIFIITVILGNFLGSQLSWKKLQEKVDGVALHSTSEVIPTGSEETVLSSTPS